MELTSGTSAIDHGFLRRVLVMSLILTVLVAAVLALYAGTPWALGFGAAALWSTANLAALAQLVRLALKPEGRDTVAIVVAALIKMPVLYGLGILLAVKGGFPPLSLIVGFTVPLAVLILKTFGRVLAPKVALPDREVGVRSSANHT